MDYTELVKALRYCVNARNCEKCAYRINNNSVKCRIKRVEDAAAAIEALQAEVKELRRLNMELFDDLPKLGEWVMGDWNDAHILYHCSVCGNKMLTNPDYVKKHKYCFACGAKMEVQE